MEIDESIARLGAELDKWFAENRATFVSDDRQEQGHALLGGFALVREIDRLKGDGLAAVRALISQSHMSKPGKNVASLVRGFEFAAKLADALHDELLDTDGENKVVHLMNEIANTLDGTASGRAGLAVLLDNANPGVRASAGAYLIRLMPDRVLPILREIEDAERGTSAGFNAHSAIIRWQRESKVQNR
jgi:hypothetical protein